MAELHVLGQIYGVSEFNQYSSLFCRYSFQSGPNWTSICGSPEGQTVSSSSVNGDTVWGHPIDLHYVTRGIQGWPKLLLQVAQLDTLNRCWLVGYSCCNIPSTPGHHYIKVPCWVPSAVSITDKLRQYFLGGSHQLVKPDALLLGSDRFKLKTQSKGNVIVKLDIILRNFNQFGVEYK